MFWYWTLSKKFYFFNFKFTKAKFLHNFFLARDNLIVNNIVFREDTGNIRKVTKLHILKKKKKKIRI